MQMCDDECLTSRGMKTHWITSAVLAKHRGRNVMRIFQSIQQQQTIPSFHTNSKLFVLVFLFFELHQHIDVHSIDKHKLYSANNKIKPNKSKPKHAEIRPQLHLIRFNTFQMEKPKLNVCHVPYDWKSYFQIKQQLLSVWITIFYWYFNIFGVLHGLLWSDELFYHLHRLAHASIE